MGTIVRIKQIETCGLLLQWDMYPRSFMETTRQGTGWPPGWWETWQSIPILSPSSPGLTMNQGLALCLRSRVIDLQNQEKLNVYDPCER